ncbi:hypothetical protein L596_019484 [Steinernema carpocapsae]|uniref:Aminopeptidase n=1 Tax=Steinernema carpocapsae TaxID=34508 RepID=A0A4U5MQM8_STECR|nr:hypothetical protein L596_019484 [Steinernema carpocapsae]
MAMRLAILLLSLLSLGLASNYPRLPIYAKPIHYDLFVKPNLEKFTTEGVARIDVEIKNDTNVLKLHAADLDIFKVELMGDKENQSLPFTLDKSHEFLNINLTKTFTKDQNLTIAISYKGLITDKLHGVYRSAYTVPSTNTTKYLMTTQFESTYARYAFPCWDEPIFKAKFTMTLDVDETHEALSNMLESSVTLKNGRKIVRFETSPLMSTYLVAMIVGEMDYLEGRTKDDMRVRVYTTPGKSGTAHLALKTHIRALEYYNKLFDFPMALKKCDGVALADFALGAMENWGLITYREAYLLMDDATTSIALKAGLAGIISHEVGHFWFGNLVTMKWWDNLWLKEGFATFLQNLFSEDNYPEFRAWDLFLADDVETARDLDSLEHSHPIQVPIDNPSELDLIYDGVSYEKSGSIIRMLYVFLGREKFLDGLRHYIKTHEYSNAAPEDLWNAFSKATSQDIRLLMKSWTEQQGYPVLTVAQNRDSQINISQKRFLANGKSVPYNQTWKIPLEFALEVDGKTRSETIMMEDEKLVLARKGLDKSKWLQLNPKTSGFYHVKYESKEMFGKLLEAYRKKEIDEEARYTLAADTTFLVYAGLSPISDLLELLNASSSEDATVVIPVLATSVFQLNKFISQSGNLAVLHRFQHFVISVFEKSAEAIGWNKRPSESSEVSYNRAPLKSIMVTVRHEPTIQESMRRFKSEDYASELKPVLYRVTAQDGVQGYRTILKLMEEATEDKDRELYQSALGYITDEEALKELLDYVLVEENIRSQDLFDVIGALGKTPNGQKLGWEFVKKNFDKIKRRYESPVAYIIVQGLMSLLRSTTDVAVMSEVRALFTEKEANEIRRTLGELEERIYIHGRQWKLHGKAMEQWLENRGF